MALFHRKEKRSEPQTATYDRAKMKPVIRCSICTGEQVAGFMHLDTGRFEEVALLREERDLQAFRERFGITEEIGKIY